MLLSTFSFQWTLASLAQKPEAVEVSGASVLNSMSDTTGTKKKYNVKISGVLQVHYLNEFNTNGDTIRDPDGFRILRARLIAKGRINKFTSYELMIDPRAPEPGGMLRDCFIAFDLGKHQQVRVGQQKTQFGYENTQSITELYTVNRSELCDGAMRGETLRDIGIGLLGEVPLGGKRWRLENAVTFTNGTRSTVAGPFDFNTRKAVWGRVGLRYKQKGLEVKVGGSFATGGIRYLYDNILDPADDVYSTFDRSGADVQVEHKWFHLTGEFAQGTDVVADTLFAEPTGFSVIAAGKTKWNIGPLVRFEQFESDYERTTLGFYYGKPKDALRVLLNYELRGNIKDIPEGHDDRLYVQLQLLF
jgi:hypothetical protein